MARQGFCWIESRREFSSIHSAEDAQFHSPHRPFNIPTRKKRPVTFLDTVLLIAAFLAGCTAAYLWYRTKVCVIEGRAQNDLDRWKNEHTKEIRKDSVNRSRSTLKGRISEQMAPLLPEFPYATADARFIGNPIDFVVFDGYTDAKDGGGDRISVVLVEVKKGKGRLTREELLIRKAIEEGRVSWKEIYLKDEEPGPRESG
jgi:predicted Holliday junction resolvase-like endonuclease